MVFMIICAGVATSLIVYLICDFIQFSIKDGYGNYNQISFDRFVAFYDINPDRWDLHGDYVIYRKTHSYFVDTVEFHFTFLERCKYKRWRKHLERLETKDREQRLKKVRLEEYQEVLECVKKDLEAFNRKNDEMMQREVEKYAKAIDDMLRIPDDGYQFKSNVAKIQRYLWEHEME